MQVPKLNFLGGDDFGRDPMTGFMTGLFHSPIASTEFFNTTEPQDNAEWVLKERPWLDDSPLDDGDANQGREATGKALIAAATGVDPGDPNARPVEHNAAQRGVVDRSLGMLADLGDDFPSE
ncbi:hypothetical protein ACIREE_27585 [Streptomyces sp. NPDC102467]|uniref:hypothetical protein n=1 Tax=Streptomyces sp. NPDC102467 TaxID=3366179 RepID=UPI003813817D